MQKQIEVFDKDMKSLGIFLTIDELIEQSEEKFGTKFAKNGIYWACNGRIKEYKGFILKYVNVKIEVIKDDISLGIFDGAYNIEDKSEKLFGIKLFSSGIRDVCEGRLKNHKGFTFKYIVDNGNMTTPKKEKELKERKVFLDNLPKWEKGEGFGNEGTINWVKSAKERYKVPFIYDDIVGEIEIIGYDFRTQKLSLKYLDYPINIIHSYSFKNGDIAKIVYNKRRNISMAHDVENDEKIKNNDIKKSQNVVNEKRNLYGFKHSLVNILDMVKNFETASVSTVDDKIIIEYKGNRFLAIFTEIKKTEESLSVEADKYL